MTEYYNINYENDEIDKLDKMARELNNKKTSLCRQVANDFNNKEEKWKSGIDNVLNSEKFSYLPMNKNFNKGLYNNNLYDETMSAETYDTFKTDKTDKTDKTNKTYTDYSVSDISYGSNFSDRDNKYFSDTQSIDSFFDDKSIDSYLNSKENKKNVKFNKIIESINYDDCSKDDDNIFEHVKKCNNCKNKLLRFLNNNNSDTENKCKYSKIFDKNKNINNPKDLNKQFNVKEIVIFLMIGIFIIIMLDILLRYKN